MNEKVFCHVPFLLNLEAYYFKLDLNVSIVMACLATLGMEFQSFMVFGKKEFCRIVVLQRGCMYPCTDLVCLAFGTRYSPGGIATVLWMIFNSITSLSSFLWSSRSSGL